jgi:hypothetical protein
MPTTPCLLADNVFNRIQQYRSGALTASSEVVGYEARRLASYRRERQGWQPTDDGAANTPEGHCVKRDLGLGVATSVDYVMLDRGSNLWGRTFYIEGSDDDFVTTALSIPTAVPPLDANGNYPVGGDPSNGTCGVTEEGAAYALFGLTAPRRYWQIRPAFEADYIPFISGLMLGRRHQLLGYASTLDEDAGSSIRTSQQSDAGYLGFDRVYDWRTLKLDLKYIGAPEYDERIRQLRTLFFKRNAPALIAMNWADYPERAWLYQWDSTSWSAAMQRAYRSTTMTFRECGHSVDL